MLTHEIIAALSEQLSPADLRRLFLGLVCVPEAWDTIHEDGCLWSFLGNPDIKSYTIQSLVENHLNQQIQTGLDRNPPGPWMELKQAAFEDHDSVHTLQDVGVLAQFICSIEDNLLDAIEAMRVFPENWSSPFIVAWPLTSRPLHWMKSLAEADHPVLDRILIMALAANLEPEEMSRHLGNFSFQSSWRILSSAADLGIPLLRSALQDDALDQDKTKYLVGEERHLPDLTQARLAKLEGDFEQAQKFLQAAWEQSTEATATIADELAEAAEAEGLEIIALEARKRALETKYSTERRAKFALALAEHNRLDEAVALLGLEVTNAQEMIAMGYFQKASGNSLQAAESFLMAVNELQAASSGSIWGISSYWTKKLIAGLEEIERKNELVQAAGYQTEQSVFDVQSRIEYARLLHGQGNDELAASQAQLATMLDPSAAEAHRLAGISLKAMGYHRAALHQFGQVGVPELDDKFMIADCLLAIGEHLEAKSIAQSMLEDDPESPKALVLMGTCLWEQGDHAAAGRLFHHAAETEPTNPYPALALVEYLKRVHGEDEAERHLKRSLDRMPGEVAITLKLAELYLEKKAFHQAIDFAQQAVELNPGRVDSLILLANCLIAIGELDQAQTALDSAGQFSPNRWEILYAQARIKAAKEDYAGARKLLLSLPDSASADAHLLTAELLLDPSQSAPGLELINRASAALKNAEAKGAQEPGYAYWQGRLFVLEQQPANAFQALKSFLETCAPTEKHIQSGIEMFASLGNQLHLEELALQTLEPRLNEVPFSPYAIEQLVRMYIALNRVAKASRISDLAIQRDPQSAHALRAVGLAAAAGGDYQRAKFAYTDLIQQDAESADGWIGLAQANSHLGDIDDTRSALARAVKSERRKPHHIRAAAELFVEIGESKGAIRILIEESRRTPEDPETLALLAQLSEESGDFTTAVDAWRGIVQSAKDPAYMNLAAKALWRLNQTEQALDILETALAADPSDAHTRSELARGFIQSGQPEKGLAVYRDGYLANPEDARLAQDTGWAEIQYGSTLAAEGIFRKLLAQMPGDSQIRLALAECSIREQNWDQALSQLDEALKLGMDPSDQSAIRAFVQAQRGEVDACSSAVAHLSPAMLKDDTEHIRAGRALCFLGELSDAMDLIKNASEAQDSPALRIEALNISLLAHETAWIFEAAGADQKKEQLRFLLNYDEDDFEAALTEIEIRPSTSVDSVEMRKTLFFNPESASADRIELELEPLEAHKIQNAIRIAHLRLGAYEKAIQIGDQSHSNPQGSILLGMASLESGDPIQAREILGSVAPSSLYYPMATYLIGRSYLSENRIPESLQTMLEAVNYWPNEARWRFEIASIMLSEGDIDSSLVHFQHATQHAPGNGEYQLGYARVLRDTGHLSEAERAFQKAIEHLPPTVSVFKEAAEVALSTGNVGLSNAWFTQALSMTPGDEEAQLGAIKANLIAGKHQDAALQCKEGLRRSPDHPELLALLGEIYDAQGEYSLALQSYEEALKNTVYPAKVHRARSRIFSKLGDTTAAAAVMRELTEAEPEDISNWLAMSDLCRQIGDYDGALKAIQAARKLSPSDPATRLELARIYRETGQLDRSLAEILDLQAEQPANGQLAFELAEIYETRREHEKALNAYESAIALDSNSRQAYVKAGQLLRGMRSYEKAARFLEKAVELNPKDAEALHQLAAVRALELVHGGFRNSTVST